MALTECFFWLGIVFNVTPNSEQSHFSNNESATALNCSALLHLLRNQFGILCSLNGSAAMSAAADGVTRRGPGAVDVTWQIGRQADPCKSESPETD